MAFETQSYEAPSVTRIGTFEDITQGNTVGAKTDAVLPVGTPVNQIPGFLATHLS